MASIAIINPRFEVSYWGQEYAMPISGKKANMPVGALPLLAALTPPEHKVLLIDENVEDLNLDVLTQMDIVAVTGMSVQRFRMKQLLEDLKKRNIFTAVGGAWVTVQEDYFKGLADVIFVGEADETWPLFLDDWENGKFSRRYEQAKKTDMTTLPVPRYDLLKMKHYQAGSIQISRGCPFLCEFCDIIVTFGRLPRLKTSQQVISELDALRRFGTHIVFVVDDNFIGNKKAIKPILKDILAYQEAHGYPFLLCTEATLDLAEDPELLQLMVQANFYAVFIGIESPKAESLEETKKFQNVRPAAGTMHDRVRTIQCAGLDVWAGMIVGFDNDDATIFSAQEEFINETSISAVMLGMLYAIPKTPLHAKLASTGRLDLSDVSEFGTNVIPLKMSRRELRDGYVETMTRLHETEAYFTRVDSLYSAIFPPKALGQFQYWDAHLLASIKAWTYYALASFLLYGRLMRHVKDQYLRAEYRKRILSFIKTLRPHPVLIMFYILRCGVQFHAWHLSRRLLAGDLVSTL